MLTFPEGFLWGVSTSAHQFEGRNSHNQWAAWERRGRIRSGDSCWDACGWWHSAERDIELCRQMGLNALRISVDWGRIEPRECEWNRAAIHRYRALLSKIRAAGMRPFVTLHHFTHPVWFEERSAFLSARSVEQFAAFAERVVGELGDLCSDFVTFNEPNVYAAFGYLFGNFPPGHRYRVRDCAQVTVNLHRAHTLAYERIHEVHASALVGLATHWVDFQAATDSPADRLLAFLYDAAFNRSSLQLLRCGSLPFPLGSIAPEAPEVMGKIDFVGLNVYSRLHVKSPWDEASRKTGGLFVPEGAPQGDPGVDVPYGEAYPDVVTNSVREFAALGVPMYIMENGVPDRADRIRPWVLTQSVRRTHETIERGFDVRGYFHWSIVDNFEWCEGWTLRFGLYEMDPRTQERFARGSAEIYRQIIQQNGLSDEQLSRFSDPPVPSGRELVRR
ncbi:MAG: glycoside hydrolase family 1 protein [Terriglobales bacterium]